MNDRPFYCVPDGGRTTVLRRIPNSRAQTVATMLGETQALALATTLNDYCSTVDECLSTLRRERAQFAQVVAVLRNLVTITSSISAGTVAILEAPEFDRVRNEAIELLAVCCPKPQPVTAAPPPDLPESL